MSLLQIITIKLHQTASPLYDKGHPQPDGLDFSRQRVTLQNHTGTHKEKRDFSVSTEIPYLLLAGPMGLEPTASGVTGR